jgi:hypothetical protein
MTHVIDKLPDNTLDMEDPGDRTQNRFRFQAAYAADLAVHLLDVKSDIDEIYCEQYEDVLAKLRTGHYAGVQVKTREKSLGPFKFGDDEILQSLKRFIKHELRFPSLFFRYVICSNCGFLQETSGNSLSKCVDLVKKYHGSKKCLSELNFSDKIEKLSRLANCSEKVVFSVLNKVYLTTWADLDNYETILAGDIAVVTGIQHESVQMLNQMAKDLIALTLRAAAASRPNTLTTPSYYVLLDDPQQATLNAVLQDKRITKSVVQDCLNQCQQSKIFLQSIKPRPIPLSPMGTEIMEVKLTAGGIDASNIELMKDLNWSSQRLFIQWLFRRGREEAERHADHLSILVRSDCQEVHDSVYRNDAQYGQQMLQGVRRKLDETYETLKSQYSEINRLHLVGIAGILTEECDVWWSERFPIQKGGI